MTNSLTKNFTTVIIPGRTYQQWIPGYSYFKDDSNALLTESGRIYFASLLTSLGYRVSASDLYFTPGSIPSYSVYYNETAGVGNDFIYRPQGWVLNFYNQPLLIGGYGLVSEKYSTVNSYFDTYPGGETINIPGSYTTITTGSTTAESPLIGWNAGAYSVGSINTGTVEFSINELAVGIFIGLTNSNIAGLDVRRESIKYAVYAHLGVCSVYINNIKLSSDYSFVTTDIFKILLSTTRVAFYINDEVIFTIDKDSDSIYYVLDSSLYYSGDTILNSSINTITSSDAYFEINGTIGLSGNVLSSGYSSIFGSLGINGSIRKDPDFTGNIGFSGNVISEGLCDISGKIGFETRIIQYQSIITGNIGITGNVLSKYGSSIFGKLGVNGLAEAGGVNPVIPMQINCRFGIEGFIRNEYLRKPQIFIIT